MKLRTLTRTGLVCAAALMATSLLPVSAAQAALSAPAGLQVTASSKGAIDLSWQALAAGESAYRVLRAARPAGAAVCAPEQFAVIGTTDAADLTYADRGLTPGATYCYSVAAVDGAGDEGERSAAVVQSNPTQAMIFIRDTMGTSETILASAPLVGGIPSATFVELARSSKPIWGLSVSPDGTQVAYSQDDSATDTNLYVRKVDGSGDPRQLTSAAGQERFPTWSPTGSTILFSQFAGDEDSIGDLRTVPAVGGAAAMLAGNGGAGHDQGTYTPDGAGIVAVNGVYRQATGDPVLTRIAVATGVRTTITGSLGMSAPTVSPDGARVAGECVNINPAPVLGSSICLLPIAGGKPSNVSSLAAGGAVQYAEDYAPEWSVDGSRVHFARYAETGVDSSQSLASALATGAGQVVAASAKDVFADYPQVAAVDTVAPTSYLTAPTVISTFSPSIAVAWTGYDRGGHGIKSYDVRFTRYSYTGARVESNLLTATTLRTKTVTVSKGYTYCFSVRARDALGNTAPAFSTARCITVPLDDTSLARSKGWSTAKTSSYYGGSAVTIAKRGAALSRTGVRAKQIGVVVRACPTCGAVSVYIGSTRLGTISTRGSWTYRKMIWLPASTSLRAGTVKLVTTSSARVYIDGIAVKGA